MRYVMLFSFVSLIFSLVISNSSLPTEHRAKGHLQAAEPEKPIFPVTWPTNGTVSSEYGPRDGGFHHGLDIVANVGTEVRAIASGTIQWAGPATGFGNCVVVHHDFDLKSTYGHLSEIAVHVGQTVEIGQLIGYVGNTGVSTGPHLHLEISYQNQPINPLTIVSDINGMSYDFDHISLWSEDDHGQEEWPIVFELM